MSTKKLQILSGIPSTADDIKAVSYDTVQELTDEQKEQARMNIGAGTPVTIPTNISAFTNDAGYLDGIPDEYVTEAKLIDKGYLTEHQSLAEYAKTQYVDDKVADLVNSAPDKLNTLDELAAALGDDENFANTVADQISKKVDKVDGKGLSTNDYTTDEKTKLANIADGAEVNVNADWNATSGDAQILNKPTLGALAAKDTVEKTDLASDVQTSLGKADTALQSYTETDPTVPAWAKATTKPTYTASEVGADISGSADAVQVNLDKHIDKKDNPHGVTLSQLGVTATAAELNTLDGITATTAELNYVDGVTSNIQVQFDSLSSEIANLLTYEDWVFTFQDGSTITKQVYTGSLSTETLTFTLENGSTVTKGVYVK